VGQFSPSVPGGGVKWRQTPTILLLLKMGEERLAQSYCNRPKQIKSNKLEKHSESADLRQGSSLPPYGIVRNAAFLLRSPRIEDY